MNKIEKSLPMEQYLKAAGLAHHDLAEMSRTPAHFKYRRENPEEEKTRALIVGDIAHIAVLEPNRFKDSHYVKPKTYEDEKGKVKPWNGNANVCKDWLEKHSDREVLTPLEAGSVIGMRKSVMENRTAKEILKKGDFEVSLFATDPETQIQLKARPDWISGRSLVNLKTTDDASKEAFQRSIEKFHYDSAAAFHLDVCNLLGLQKEFYVFIVVEKEPPFAMALYELDEKSKDIGRLKYRRWLSLYSHCANVDEWPGYDESIQPISLRDWHIRQTNLALAE